MAIRRYTSPTQELIIEDMDLSSADIYVTYRQGSVNMTFSGDDIEVSLITDNDRTDTLIQVYLSQNDTAKFSVGEASVEVNWILDGQRNATSIDKFEIKDNLLKEVIS